jgi:hypothetical protein
VKLTLSIAGRPAYSSVTFSNITCPGLALVASPDGIPMCVTTFRAQNAAA